MATWFDLPSPFGRGAGGEGRRSGLALTDLRDGVAAQFRPSPPEPLHPGDFVLESAPSGRNVIGQQPAPFAFSGRSMNTT